MRITARMPFRKRLKLAPMRYWLAVPLAVHCFACEASGARQEETSRAEVARCEKATAEMWRAAAGPFPCSSNEDCVAISLSCDNCGRLSVVNQSSVASLRALEAKITCPRRCIECGETSRTEVECKNRVCVGSYHRR